MSDDMLTFPYRLICIDRVWKPMRRAAIREAQRQIVKEYPDAQYMKTRASDDFWLVEFKIAETQ